jgi:hypothetical protein
LRYWEDCRTPPAAKQEENRKKYPSRAMIRLSSKGKNRLASVGLAVPNHPNYPGTSYIALEAGSSRVFLLKPDG